MRHHTSPSASELSRMTTEEVRRHFLLDGLFTPGTIQMVYTDLDRMIAGGIMPTSPMQLPVYKELASSYFTERREVGIINIGDLGVVQVGGETYRLDNRDCLYIGIGEPEITFHNGNFGQAVFYLLSAPAHRKFPTCAAGLAEASGLELGNQASASRRKLVQYIHEDGIQSCQLVMGYTAMEQGSVWNTWPPHTHLRRSEIYLYFGLGESQVIHLAGQANQSRHIVVRDRQAVTSPPWSIHTGVGTGPYSFVWGMAGENKAFADMDPVSLDSFV